MERVRAGEKIDPVAYANDFLSKMPEDVQQVFVLSQSLSLVFSTRIKDTNPEGIEDVVAAINESGVIKEYVCKWRTVEAGVDFYFRKR